MCSLSIEKAAPGKVSATMDTWTRDNTCGSYLGMTAHWIEVKGADYKKKEWGTWKLCSEVIAFQGISGNHLGENIGQYVLGLARRIGIINKLMNISKVHAHDFVAQLGSY